VEPTVTDAMLVLGFIDPANYLGGRYRLHRDLAEAAIRDRFAAPFAWSVEEASAAIHDLTVVNMANAVREVSVGRGQDPRGFTFIAYGGMLPLFAGQIADRLEIPIIAIPRNSSVFCAQGLLESDFVVRQEQTVEWPLDGSEDVSRVNGVAEQLVKLAGQRIREEGFGEREITIRRSAEFRFEGQVYELALPLPERALSPGDGEGLRARFYDLYESTYGAGTAWQGARVVLLNYVVTAVGRRERDWQPSRLPAASVTVASKGSRAAYLPMLRERVVVPVFDGGAFPPGDRVEGPAMVDETDPTIFVPPGHFLSQGDDGTYLMKRQEGATR
jgi:N-methylhydantoinase A